MRELKFRAWDKTRKRFIHVPDMKELMFEYGMNYSYTNGDDIEIMQYTGLKDRNDVEIYESDVVRWDFGKHFWEAEITTCKSHPNGQLYAIETINNCSVDEESDTYTYEITNGREGARNEIAFLSRRIEVIGNIHENPELLESK